MEDPNNRLAYYLADLAVTSPEKLPQVVLRLVELRLKLNIWTISKPT